MKVKLSTVTYIKVEIDGAPVRYMFEVESKWEKFIKLKAVHGPMQQVIIEQPNRPNNPYDFLHPLFGGNECGSESKSLETECIYHDLSELKQKTNKNE